MRGGGVHAGLSHRRILLPYTVSWNGTHLHDFNDLASPGLAKNGLYLLNVTPTPRCLIASSVGPAGAEPPSTIDPMKQAPRETSISIFDFMTLSSLG